MDLKFFPLCLSLGFTSFSVQCKRAIFFSGGYAVFVTALLHRFNCGRKVVERIWTERGEGWGAGERERVEEKRGSVI